MSADEWIKLHVHPLHPKVLHLAEITGRPVNDCFAATVLWFRHVDQHCENEHTGIGEVAFRIITGWSFKTSLYKAMQDPNIGWIEENAEGLACIVDFDKHFGRGAKRRALKARAEANRRGRKRTESMPTGRPRVAHRLPTVVTTQEQEQEQEQQQSKSDTAAAVCPETGQDGQPTTRMDALEAAGVGEPNLSRLAAKGHLTVDVIERVANDTRQSGGGVGLLIRKLEDYKPASDPVLAADRAARFRDKQAAEHEREMRLQRFECETLPALAAEIVAEADPAEAERAWQQYLQEHKLIRTTLEGIGQKRHSTAIAEKLKPGCLDRLREDAGYGAGGPAARELSGA